VKRLNFLSVLLAGMLVLGLGISAAADKVDKKQAKADANSRSLEGVVMDGSDTPIEGAVVQLKDTKSLQIRSFITRTDGKFHFYGLSRDVDYEVRADNQGKSSQQKTLSSFDSRKQAVMNLKVEK